MESLLWCAIKGSLLVISNSDGKFELQLLSFVGSYDFADLVINLLTAKSSEFSILLNCIPRIELNYCIPVKAQRGDRMAPGLQFGIGVDFL